MEGKTDDTPKSLDTPGKRALFDNLDHNEALALQVHQAVMAARPSDWRGVLPREQVVKQALYGVLQDVDKVNAVFGILKAQPEF
jgi:type I restriction enzyme R subunit